MTIDTHLHFWIYHEERHQWIDDGMKEIRKNFLPRDIKPVFEENSIDGCIAVQADQTEEENKFLLDLAKEHNFIRGVIGWVDFKKRDIAERLDYYAQFEKIKGFRHVVQGEADPNFLLRTSFLEGISNLEKHNFCYEILVFPHQLGAVLEFVKRFPNQKFVIDHIAKPYIKDGFMDGWKIMITEISKCENVYCKLSGLITEADYKKWTFNTLLPYIDVIKDAFGPRRLMYGSDWPVGLVAGEYKEIKEVAEQAVSDFSFSEKEAFWGGNAIKFYNL